MIDAESNHLIFDKLYLIALSVLPVSREVISGLSFPAVRPSLESSRFRGQ
jgi:hypothetical protein